MRLNPKTIILNCRSIATLPLKCLRALSTVCQRTNYRRWTKNVLMHPSWDDRTKCMAALIPNGSRVIDIGAGAQTLKMHLGEACAYQPCDMVKSSPNCLLCDFNKNIYPEARNNYDYVVISGVMEYIHKPRDFIRKITQYGRLTILSYNPWDGHAGSKLLRLSEGWVSHLQVSDLDRIFANLSIESKRVGAWKGHIIYHLRPRRTQEGAVD
jgi:hypothetical protein